MDEVLVADYFYIRNKLINAKDEKILRGYLECMIVLGDTWPDHFRDDVDVFNTNPSELFNSQTPDFVVVNNPTEACGRTDGCASGSWRIIGREKLIRSKKTGKILGFKKILKFCKKTKPREYKRSWVMEVFRLVKSHQQHLVICKIRFLFEAEISSLLRKHFSCLPIAGSIPITGPIQVPADQLLPAYGVLNTEAERIYYLWAIMAYDDKNSWPSHVTNNVHRLHPLTLVDPQDNSFREYGTCIFANRTETCGITDRCDGGGCWRILHGYVDIQRPTGMTLGYGRSFRYWENEVQGDHFQGEGVTETWILEEYRLAEEEKKHKVLCVIKKYSYLIQPIANGIH